MAGRFCTTLRHRPDLAPVVSILQQCGPASWRELKLLSHDLAIPFPAARNSQDVAVFHFVLLSAADVGQAGTEKRLEKLHRLCGGGGPGERGSKKNRVGVVFLLGEGVEGCVAFQQLQIDVINKFEDMPIAPIASLDALPGLMKAFQANLSKAMEPPRLPAPAPPAAVIAASSASSYLSPPFSPDSVSPETLVLLKDCSERRPLPGPVADRLSSVARSFGDLVDQIDTDEGRARIWEQLGDRYAENAVAFWLRERPPPRQG